MVAALATRANVFSLGLRAEMFVARARAVRAVDIATAVFRLDGHGFDTGLPLVNFLANDSAVLGVASPSLPPEISAATTYQPSAYNGSGALFRVTPVGGAIITSLTNAGVGVFSIQSDVGPTIDAIAADETAQIFNALTAYAPPVAADVLIGLCARRSARRARIVLGLANPLFADSFRALEEAKKEDDALLAEWKQGRGILPTPTDQTPGTSENAARATFDLEGAGWETGTL